MSTPAETAEAAEAAEVAAPDELREQLAEHRASLAELEALLAADPDDAEARAAADDTREVIALTEELLAEAEAAQAGGSAVNVGSVLEPPVDHAAAAEQPESLKRKSRWGDLPAHAQQALAAAQARVEVVQQQEVQQQQQESAAPLPLPALVGTGFAVGSKVEARFSDGKWYEATVVSAADGGGAVVRFKGYDGVESVGAEDVRVPSQHPRPAIVDGLAPEEIVKLEMPKKLLVKETDDEATRKKKKKGAKAFKSAQRFARYDVEQNERTNSWKNFQAGSKKKKKAGFFSGGAPKESMFKSSEHGKVGVIAHGFTEGTKATKHAKGKGPL